MQVSMTHEEFETFVDKQLADVNIAMAEIDCGDEFDKSQVLLRAVIESITDLHTTSDDAVDLGSTLIRVLPTEVKAALLREMTGSMGKTDTIPVELRKDLVDLADHLGPDYTQAWYHMAVFMTKVA